MFRSCSILPERIFLCLSICSNSLTMAFLFSLMSLPPEDFSKTARQNSKRWQSMSLQPMWRQYSWSSTFISLFVKPQAKVLSFECPKSMKSTFLGLVASRSFLRNMPQSSATAVDSLMRRVTLNSAILAASSRAFRSCWVRQAGTASTPDLFSKLFFCRMNLSLLRQAANTCSGNTVSACPWYFTSKATRSSLVTHLAGQNFFSDLSRGQSGLSPRNLMGKETVSLKLDFILMLPASPMLRSAGPQPTTQGVSLKLASLVMISTPPLLATAILLVQEPRSMPMGALTC